MIVRIGVGGHLQTFRRFAAAAVATTLALTGAGARAGEDLPSALLAASSGYGKVRDETICYPFLDAGLIDQSSYGGADYAVSVTPAPGYSANTAGAYLGNRTAGRPALPFIQALLDAGAASAVPLTWESRVRGTGGALTSGKQSPGVAYLVSGPDRDLFGKPDAPVTGVTAPPSLRRGDEDANPKNPPTGVWVPRSICFRVIAERVLEDGTPVDNGNGTSDVIAAILVRPERRPAWLADPRVVEAARPNMPAHFAVWLTFRNNGDGWRYVSRSLAMLAGRTHIVAAGR